LQAVLGALGAVEFIVMYFLFPEASEPGKRGIDKLTLEHKPARLEELGPE